MDLNNDFFRPSAVIFDMDGLMLDTEWPLIPLWAQVSKTFGYEVPTELIHRMVGISSANSRAVMRQRFPDFPYDAVHTTIRKMMHEEYDKNGIPHKKGLVYLLDRLTAAKIPYAVATSTRKATAVGMLSKAGVLDRFTAIVGGDDIVNGKPAPDIFLLAAEKLGSLPSSCIGFEDSTAGLMALHAAGIRSVFIKDIVQPPPEVLASVWRSYDDLAQAAELFGQC